MTQDWEKDNSDRPGENGDSGPLSPDDWEKELADIKGEISDAPEIPEKPVRLPTPPPGGFIIPALPTRNGTKPTDGISANSDSMEEIDVEEPDWEEEEEEVEEEDDFEDEELEDESGEEDIEEEEESELEERDDISYPSDSASSVSRADIEAALDTSTGDLVLPRKSGGKAGKKTGTSGVLFSTLLFFVLAFSVFAGYYFRSRKGVEYYIKRLGSEDAAVQNHARDSLSFFGSLAVPGLVDVVESGKEREAVAAIDTLALIETEESVKILMSLTTHPNPNLRRRALSALGERAAPQAFKNIEQQVYANDHDTRLCAIAALENFDPQKSVPILLELLNDKDWRIRNEAGKTLQTVTGQDIGVPKSTYSEKMNEIIRQKWNDWWAKEGQNFKKPVSEQE